jgi:hypothetical protein
VINITSGGKKMAFTAKRSGAFCAAILALAILASCSSEPAGPAKGTPAFYWQAAGETYKAGDYRKTLEHLDKVLADDNEYTARALPWALVLTSGMASGYMDLADHYEIGGRVNKSDPSAFRRRVSNFRGLANRLSLQFAENAAKMDRVKGDSVPLAFGYPNGTATPVASLSKVVNGIVLPDAEAEAAQKPETGRSAETGHLLPARPGCAQKCARIQRQQRSEYQDSECAEDIEEGMSSEQLLHQRNQVFLVEGA